MPNIVDKDNKVIDIIDKFVEYCVNLFSGQ